MSTASTAALSSVLSALNSGSSGIDVTSAVASIIAADRAPEQAWESQQTVISNQEQAIQQLESESSSLTDSLESFGDVTGVLSSLSASSSNTDVLTASAQAGAAVGTHSITVSQLATTGSWYSDEQTSASAALPNGSFTITVGNTANTFETGSTIDSLQQLSSAINSAGIGVDANVVADASGARLSLVASNSGAAADLSISDDTGLGFTRAVVGQNASLTVDGAPVTSTSNTVSNVISGLTLSLTGVSATSGSTSGATPAYTPTVVSLTPDSDSIESAVDTFVNAYNSLVGSLNAEFTYHSSSGSEGILATDSAARAMQNDVLAAANISIGTGSSNTLASLGITTNQDGTLALDTSSLQNAISNNYQGVVNFFQGQNGTAGFAATVTQTLSSYTDASQGAFTVDLQSLNNENQDLTNEINTFELYISSQQTLLTTEYNKANIALQQLPEQIKQVQALLGEDNSGSSS